MLWLFRRRRCRLTGGVELESHCYDYTTSIERLYECFWGGLGLREGGEGTERERTWGSDPRGWNGKRKQSSNCTVLGTTHTHTRGGGAIYVYICKCTVS